MVTSTWSRSAVSSLSDNYDLWRRREAEQEAWLETRPICDHCGQPIQDENLYDFDGVLYHEDCMNENFRKRTEDSP